MIASPGTPAAAASGTGDSNVQNDTQQRQQAQHEQTLALAAQHATPAPAAAMDSAQVWEWYNSHPLLVGFNYLPRNAVNFLDMWTTSWDVQLVDQELKWAAKRGYNSLRTNLSFALFEQDVELFTHRLDGFLNLAQKHNISVMLCPMDDCEFGGSCVAATAMSSLDPVKGVHNSRAVGSPGRQVVMDACQWHRVEAYIRYVIRTWGGDSRVLLWDLWNEPGNTWEFTANGTNVMEGAALLEEQALLLMEHVFEWARQEHPLQPLSTSAWHVPDPFFDNITEESSPMIALSHPIDQRAMQLSDVITIHAYCGPDLLKSMLSKCSMMYNKPIMLTEWMARHANSTFESLLPVLEDYQVGSYQWGLVAGKSQTYLPWPHVAEAFCESKQWFHDVLNADGTAHDEDEMTYLKDFCLTVQDRILAKRAQDKDKKTLTTTAPLIVCSNTMATVTPTTTSVELVPPAATATTNTPLNAIMTAVVELAVHQQQEQALIMQAAAQQHHHPQPHSDGMTTATTYCASTMELGDDIANLLY